MLATIDEKYLVWQARCRRGSLPIKKRRIALLVDNENREQQKLLCGAKHRNECHRGSRGDGVDDGMAEEPSREPSTMKQGGSHGFAVTDRTPKTGTGVGLSSSTVQAEQAMGREAASDENAGVAMSAAVITSVFAANEVSKQLKQNEIFQSCASTDESDMETEAITNSRITTEPAALSGVKSPPPPPRLVRSLSPPPQATATTAESMANRKTHERQAQIGPASSPVDLAGSSGSVSNLEEPSEASSVLAAASANPARRVHRPPLSSPLPGGCHGRTSRNNSYCRRHPCFNGSKYCKLHYQQYVVSGMRVSESSQTTDDASTNTTNSITRCDGASGLDWRSSAVATNLSNTGQNSQQHQDKRYMGSDDEKRCCATTTRGRACAYVAVAGTKYCFLHADYDTNPPPRRGGTGGGGNMSAGQRPGNDVTVVETESPFRAGGKEAMSVEGNGGSLPEASTSHTGELQLPPSIASTLSAAEVSVSSPPSDASEGSSRLSSPFWPNAPISTAPSETLIMEGKQKPGLVVETKPVKSSGRPSAKTSRQASAAKLAEKHAFSPWPLLSMISTDQWFNKTVRVATGPMMDRVGKVEKWGNGWVSVNIPGVGLHNRRSFELYLLSDEDDDDEDDDMDDKGDATTAVDNAKSASSNAAPSPPSEEGKNKGILTSAGKNDPSLGNTAPTRRRKRKKGRKISSESKQQGNGGADTMLLGK